MSQILFAVVTPNYEGNDVWSGEIGFLLGLFTDHVKATEVARENRGQVLAVPVDEVVKMELPCEGEFVPRNC